MAIVMQVAAARLGIVTGKDLAQACRDLYPAWTRWPNWLLCEMRHRRLRSGRGAGQRRRDSICCSTFRSLGRDDHCLRRAAAAGAAAASACA